MKIVVIQRHIENLTGINACVAGINPKRAEEIVCTQEPRQVIDVVSGGEAALVVSGQYLTNHRFGTDLARDVKRVNPNALFFIYSVMPMMNESVDGVIPKNDDTCNTGQHELLARILASDLEGATPESLRAAFPQIKNTAVYDD